jgi:hypothetical protein
VKKATNDHERRLQLRFEYLGTNNPRCVHCGEDDPFCLELHEPGGRAFSDLSVIECRNCHRKLENGRNDHPKQLEKPPTDTERLIHFLHGLADWFALLIVHLRQFADALSKERNGSSTDGGIQS